MLKDQNRLIFLKKKNIEAMEFSVVVQWVKLPLVILTSCITEPVQVMVWGLVNVLSVNSLLMCLGK